MSALAEALVAAQAELPCALRRRDGDMIALLCTGFAVFALVCALRLWPR